MRAMTSEFDDAHPTDSLLGVLDQFAALRTYSDATPAFGGYRVLAPIGRARRATRRLRPSPAALAALARARLRLTGFLSVMFVGGLGLAVPRRPGQLPLRGHRRGCRALVRQSAQLRRKRALQRHARKPRQEVGTAAAGDRHGHGR
ncbi:MAG: hypothetical protein WDN31_04510 [Hyphomicrobium sp.]